MKNQKADLIKSFISVLAISSILISCSKNVTDVILVPTNTLDYYIQQNSDLEKDILIACAASEMPSNTDFNVSFFFYPVQGAYDYRYFEAKNDNVNPLDYTAYISKEVETPLLVFNGYLMRFPFDFTNREPWAIMTYKSAGKLHICDPVKMKQNSKTTNYSPELIQIDLSNPIEPFFSWEADNDIETVIYFQVVSDSLGNLISGTYTYGKHWQFYDLSNVVLNIHDINPPPQLEPNSKYMFTLMGVSEDNWVNLSGALEFITE